MTENNCVFCRIVKGEISSKKIYEDKDILALTPKETEAKGHTIVITKKHYLNIFDASEDDLKKLIIIIKKVSLAIKEGLNAKGVNILNASGKEAQQSVPHIHFHIIPRYDNDGVDAWMKKSDTKKYDLDEVNTKIKNNLK